MNSRTSFENSYGNKATFLANAYSTKGAYTLVEFELRPGTRIAEHFHSDYQETLELVTGNIRLVLQGEETELNPGEGRTITKGFTHAYEVVGESYSRIRVELRPAQPAYEKFIMISYGLSKNDHGFQRRLRNLHHVAILFDLSKMELTGIPKIIQTFFKAISRGMIRIGILRRLEDRYCR